MTASVTGKYGAIGWYSLGLNSPLNQRRTSSTFLGPVAALGEEVSRVLPRPTAVAADIEQHEVGQPVGIPQRVLTRHMPAERVAEQAHRSKPSLWRSASASAVRFSQVMDETGAPSDRPVQRWS